MTSPQLKKQYRKFAIKGDPRTMLQLPHEVMTDVKHKAEHNKRTLAEEIIARLAISLEHNATLLERDRLHQLIFNAKLAVDFKPPRSK